MADSYNTQDPNLMDWDDEITSDGQEFIILPEGDYNFTVTDFERGRFPGSEKLPPCNKATITMQVKTEEGVASIKTDLILYRTLEWKLSAFFRCIGQKRRGEKLVVNWNRVVGSEGRAHFKPRTYTKNGEERQANDVDKFYDYDEKFFTGSSSGLHSSGWSNVADDDELPF